jgi:hypothetical protein
MCASAGRPAHTCMRWQAHTRPASAGGSDCSNSCSTQCARIAADEKVKRIIIFDILLLLLACAAALWSYRCPSPRRPTRACSQSWSHQVAYFQLKAVRRRLGRHEHARHRLVRRPRVRQQRAVQNEHAANLTALPRTAPTTLRQPQPRRLRGSRRSHGTSARWLLSNSATDSDAQHERSRAAGRQHRKEEGSSAGMARDAEHRAAQGMSGCT